MSRSLIRAAPWTIGPDRTPGASGPIRLIQCDDCLERSEPDHGRMGPESWALAHAGRTRHTGYREVVTVPLRVVPAPGNPLYLEKGQSE